MKNLDLKECRDKVDVIDKEIVRLFEERMSVCEMCIRDRLCMDQPGT